MPPAFFTALAGWWTSSLTILGYTFSVGTWISAALAVYGIAAGQSAARRAKRDYNAGLQDRHVMIPSADAPRTIVYGRARVSGPPADAFSSGDKKEFLHLPVALAGHEIDAVEDIWFNDESIGALDGGGYVTGGPYYKAQTNPETYTATVPASPYQVTLPHVPSAVDSVVSTQAPVDEWTPAGPLTEGIDYTRSGATFTFIAAQQGFRVTITYRTVETDAFVRVKVHLGTPTQVADADLIAASAGRWTSAHQLKGAPYLYIRVKYDQDLFPTGLPNPSAVIRGRKVYDPRSGQTVWSNNPALCARDYLTDPVYGFGAASSEIDDATIIAAANICDELVPIDGVGGTQKRYTCDGVLSSEVLPPENLAAIASSMAGVVRYVGGYWSMRAGAYNAPTDTLTESDLADGTIGIVARAARRDLFNSVRGRFVDPTQLYALHDYPPYTSATYISEDAGEAIYQDIDLGMTNDATRAQRIAKLVLRQARQALTVEATFNLRAYKFAAGDTLMLTVARYGFASKVFRVLDRRLMPEGKIKLVLREEASAIYDWAYTEATNPDPAPNTALPDPRVVTAITGLAATSGATIYQELSDGTVIPEVKVSWTAITDNQVLQGGYIELWYKRAVATEWQQARINPDATFYRFVASRNELVNINVRAVNGAQVRGAWSYVNHTVASDTPGSLPELTDLGYTGDTNATHGAPSGTNVGSTPATTVESNAANGQSAYTAVNDGTTGLAQRLRSNAANILSGSGGIAVGTLTWNSSGARTGGYGVGITSQGLLGYNAAGNPTFTIDGGTGDATFYGNLSAASGTFSGTLTVGAINAVDTINIVNGAVSANTVAAASDLAYPPASGTTSILTCAGVTGTPGWDSVFVTVEWIAAQYNAGYQHPTFYVYANAALLGTLSISPDAYNLDRNTASAVFSGTGGTNVVYSFHVGSLTTSNRISNAIIYRRSMSVIAGRK